MSIYLPILTKFAIGLFALIVQINIKWGSNLAPTNALIMQLRFRYYWCRHLPDTITVFQFTIVLIIWTMLVMTVNHERT